jgi:hypothetical protein
VRTLSGVAAYFYAVTFSDNLSPVGPLVRTAKVIEIALARSTTRQGAAQVRDIVSVNQIIQRKNQ